MAGVAGLVQGGAVRQQGRLERGLAVLRHHPSFSAAVLWATDSLVLGAVHRSAGSSPFAHIPARGIVVATHGCPLLARPWRVASPECIAERYLDHGVASLSDLDGSFVVVLVDEQAGRLWLANDRTASLPVHYAQDEGRFAFAPEAKALFHFLGSSPRIDRTAALTFVNLGYPVGRRTLFDSVRLLEPAHRLEVSLDGKTAECRRCWDLQFAPTARLRPRDAVDQLRAALVASHRATVIDAPERVDLLLTGGYDSRAVLGTLMQLGSPPDECLSWGIDEGIPESDPAIARRLAADCGVPFRFLQYDASQVVHYAPRWTYVSELSSDNAGNFAAGADFFYRDRAPAPVVLIGDQMLGPGAVPLDLDDAVECVTRVPGGRLLPAWSELLHPTRRPEVEHLFRREVDRVAMGCNSDHPKDQQDYLYFHLYVFRWLFAAGYFKEPMVTPRRPLMLNSLVDLGAVLPRRLRVDKGILVQVLKRDMPRLMRSGKASAHSLVDWSYELRRPGRFRDFVADLLAPERLRQLPLGDGLDHDAADAAIRRYLAARPTPVSRAPTVVPRIWGIRRHLALAPPLGRLARRLEPPAKRLLGRKPARGDAAVVWRLALLSLLQQGIEQDWFAAAGPAVVGQPRWQGGLAE